MNWLERVIGELLGLGIGFIEHYDAPKDGLMSDEIELWR